MANNDSILSLPRKVISNRQYAASAARKWTRERTTDFDLETFFDIIASITDSDEQTVETIYRECLEEGPLDRYEAQFRQYIPTTSTTNLYRSFIGTEKYVGLNRISLYILTRLLEPEVVVETGIKWGEGSHFFLEALERNGTGELYSYDIGIDIAEQSYRFPDSVDEVGFFVPDNLQTRWNRSIGDSLDGMKADFDDSSNIDFFFHDSLHTYDHMKAEFELAARHMPQGGLLTSEDVDANNAWEDFLDEHSERCNLDCRYYAMQGIDHSVKEVAATRYSALKE